MYIYVWCVIEYMWIYLYSLFRNIAEMEILYVKVLLYFIKSLLLNFYLFLSSK